MRLKHLIFIFFAILFSIILFTGFLFYKNVFKPIETNYPAIVYVPTGANIEQVCDTLRKYGLVAHPKLFYFVSKQKNYKVKPGRYVFTKPISLNNLINILRLGNQSPVLVRFNSGIVNVEKLAEKLTKNLEITADSLLVLLRDKTFLKELGFDENTILAMFIPNTYELYWNTSAKDLILRMKREYLKFWNGERDRKAKLIGLSRVEVSTLASIVCKETLKNDEKPLIAGVYLNRLKLGMPLQADPTVIFANKAWTAQRVTKKMLQIDSPYNTYKYVGLPPGPICIPDIASIDAVLNYKKHNFLYFCAKEDFSGYHNFASSYSEHLINAKKYQRALNKLKIYK